MAHIAETLSIGNENTGLGGVFNRLADAIARRRAYSRTYAELSALSTRELEDLGISRSMISRLAYEAACKI